MTTRIHANNYATTINGAISNSVTSIVLTSVTGFPSIGSGVTCNLTLQSGSTVEIVTATALSTNTITVTRGAEGTTAISWADATSISIRPTADSVDRKLDIAGGATSRKILVSNGTSWLPSTETYAIPGTSGNVLTSDGTNWTSAAPSGGGGSGFTRTTASGTTQACVVDTYYTTTNASQCVATLPATAAVGSIVRLTGQGAGGWQAKANTGQTIQGLGTATSSAGTITPANRYDSIEVQCIVANTTWTVANFTSTALTFA